MSSTPTPLTETQRLHRLQLMRRWASGLLIGMAALYISLRVWQPVHSAWGYLQAFAEAALVGGLADWFAVTALFRRPLGLPIPHTAIIPERKDRIADSMGRFVQQNFLSTEIINDKLQQLDLAGRLTTWLNEPQNSALVAERVGRALPNIINALPHEQWRYQVADLVLQQGQQIQLSGLTADLLELFIHSGQHQRVLDEALRLVEHAFADNKQALRSTLQKEKPWYVPGFIVEKQVYEKLVANISDTLRQMQQHETHPFRQRIADALEQFIHNLRTQPDYQARTEALKQELLARPEVQGALLQLWPAALQKIQDDLDQPAGTIRTQLQQGVQALAQRLLADEALRTKLNAWVQQAILELVVQQREQVGQLIADTVKKWDARTLVQRLELQVGRDLQFIRINGTLVGGLVGLLLHLANRLFQ